MQRLILFDLSYSFVLNLRDDDAEEVEEREQNTRPASFHITGRVCRSFVPLSEDKYDV